MLLNWYKNNFPEISESILILVQYGNVLKRFILPDSLEQVGDFEYFGKEFDEIVYCFYSRKILPSSTGMSFTAIAGNAVLSCDFQSIQKLCI